MSENLKRYKTEMDARILAPLMAMWTGVVAEVYLLEHENLRHMTAEPFNIFNHLGNMVLSLQAGLVTSLLSETVSKDFVSDSEKTAERKAKKLAVAAGLATGLVLNGLVETKTGQGLIHWKNTTDPLDFAYGVGTATLTAAVASKPIIKRENPDEHTSLYLAVKDELAEIGRIPDYEYSQVD